MKITASVALAAACLVGACGGATTTPSPAIARPVAQSPVAASPARASLPAISLAPTFSTAPTSSAALTPGGSPARTPSPTTTAQPAAAQSDVCAEADLVWDSFIHELLLVNCTTYAGGPKQLTVWGRNGSAWHAVTSGSAPARVVGGTAMDNARRQLTVYGGYVPDTDPCNTETWQWDGALWSNLQVTPPPPCDHMKMIWDSEGSQSLLLGGQAAAGDAVEGTWSWDGSTWTGLDVETPPSREHFGLSYDTPNDRVLLFSGLTQSAVVGDFWEWHDGAWTELDEPPLGPRSHVGMVDTKGDDGSSSTAAHRAMLRSHP